MKALVIGWRSGIAAALISLMPRDFQVWATSRKSPSPGDPDGSQTRWLFLDPSVEASITDLIEWVDRESPDLIVFALGFAVPGHLADRNARSLLEEISPQVCVCSQLVGAADRLGRERSRPVSLVLLSSLAQTYPLPHLPVYNAVKAYQSTLLTSAIGDARGGLRGYDIRLGDVRTDFNQHMWAQYGTENDLDAACPPGIRSRLDRDLAKGLEPRRAAQGILRILDTKPPGSYVVANGSQRLLTFLGDRLPMNLRQRLLRRFLGTSPASKENHGKQV